MSGLWGEEKYRKLQGTYPVIMLSFASVKETTYLYAQKKLCHIITDLYNRFSFLLDSGILNESEKDFYRKVSADMEVYTATEALKVMSGFLMRYYGKKVIILLDEYDTPMQEAAFIMEFKVVHARRKETLEEGARSALRQIEEKQYERVLRDRGIQPEQIRKYGFAFEGSRVLIAKA